MAKIKFELPEGAESVSLKIEDGYVIATYEPKKWRAEGYGKYFYINSRGDIRCTFDTRDYCDNKRFESGNYFRAEEQAKKVADEIQQIFFKHKHDLL